MQAQQQQEPGAGDVIWMRWPWKDENGHDDRITLYYVSNWKQHTHKHSPMRVASDLKAHSVRSGTEGGKCTEKPDAGIVANESYGIGCKGQDSS